MLKSKSKEYYTFDSTSQKIDDILNSKDCSLEKLIDDEDLLQELRNSNTQLIKFFNGKEVSNLLDYIVVEPPENCDEKRAFKFPFIAAEVFSTEVNEIIDLFFTFVDSSLIGKDQDLVEITEEVKKSLNKEKLESEQSNEKKIEKSSFEKEEMESKEAAGNTNKSRLVIFNLLTD